MDHNSSDYATCESIARSCPWFEHWHKMMTNHAQTGPVVLLTGHPYDATPASSQNNLVDADVNMDDASDAHYPHHRYNTQEVLTLHFQEQMMNPNLPFGNIAGSSQSNLDLDPLVLAMDQQDNSDSAHE
ncbi:hypothetical protein NDA11_002556 [Ustilago hordei]|nr:hypothetical protein NDA11_002556 [Ustilago hordei]